MTAQPGPAHGPDTGGSYEVIHLGGRAAVVVPLADFMRLRHWSGSAPRRNWKTPRTPRRCRGGGRGRQLARPPACPPARYGCCPSGLMPVPPSRELSHVSAGFPGICTAVRDV